LIAGTPSPPSRDAGDDAAILSRLGTLELKMFLP